MNTINKIIAWINGSRKLFVSVVAILFVQFVTLVIIVMKLADSDVINLTEVIVANFGAMGIIVGAYCATNVGEHLTEKLGQWVNKRRR